MTFKQVLPVSTLMEKFFQMDIAFLKGSSLNHINPTNMNVCSFLLLCIFFLLSFTTSQSKDRQNKHVETGNIVQDNTIGSTIDRYYPDKIRNSTTQIKEVSKGVTSEINDDDDDETTYERSNDLGKILNKLLSSKVLLHSAGGSEKRLPNHDYVQTMGHREKIGIQLGKKGNKNFFNEAQSHKEKMVVMKTEPGVAHPQYYDDHLRESFGKQISRLRKQDEQIRTTRPKAENKPLNVGFGREGPFDYRIIIKAKKTDNNLQADNAKVENAHTLKNFNIDDLKPTSKQSLLKGVKELEKQTFSSPRKLPKNDYTEKNTDAMMNTLDNENQDLLEVDTDEPSLDHRVDLQNDTKIYSNIINVVENNLSGYDNISDGLQQSPLRLVSEESFSRDKAKNDKMDNQAQYLAVKNLQHNIKSGGLLSDVVKNKNHDGNITGETDSINIHTNDDEDEADGSSRKGDEELTRILNELFLLAWSRNSTDNMKAGNNRTNLNGVKTDLFDKNEPEEKSLDTPANLIPLNVELFKHCDQAKNKHTCNQISQYEENDEDNEKQSSKQFKTQLTGGVKHQKAINAIQETQKAMTWYSGKLVPKTDQRFSENGSQSNYNYSYSPEMSNWSNWSTCSATCGTNAIQIRTRQCINNKSGMDCAEEFLDWKPCIKTLICPKAKENQTPNQSTQWGPWSPCPKKCNKKTIKIRRRRCPGQRSNEKGVCENPTMEWAWCKPKQCQFLTFSTKDKESKMMNKEEIKNRFNDMMKPKNSSAQVTMHKDNDFGSTDNCSTSPWSNWSSCSRTCGENSKKFRTRSCSCPDDGKCNEPIIDWKHCILTDCPGEENYGPWSAFSSCSRTCGTGWKKRVRHCVKNEHEKLCEQDLLIGVRVCNLTKCAIEAREKPTVKDGESDNSSQDKNKNPETTNPLQASDFGYVTIGLKPRRDPELACGFNPCEEFGCIDNPYSKCQADRNCDPVFFDLNGKEMHPCTDFERYFIKKPSTFCGYDPCNASPCRTSFGNCFVDLNCRPITMADDGYLNDCRRLLALPFRAG